MQHVRRRIRLGSIQQRIWSGSLSVHSILVWASSVHYLCFWSLLSALCSLSSLDDMCAQAYVANCTRINLSSRVLIYSFSSTSYLLGLYTFGRDQLAIGSLLSVSSMTNTSPRALIYSFNSSNFVYARADQRRCESLALQVDVASAAKFLFALSGSDLMYVCNEGIYHSHSITRCHFHYLVWEEYENINVYTLTLPRSHIWAFFWLCAIA